MLPYPAVTYPIGIYITACMSVGIIGNLSIVFVTFASIHLKSTCNIIIAANCFLDALHLSGHVTYVIYLITGEQTVQSTCFFYHIHSQIGLLSCTPILLILAFDRLIAIAIPTKMVACDTPTAVAGVLNLTSEINIIFYPIIGLIYMIVILILRKKGANAQFKLVSRSITVSIFFMLITWLISFGVVIVAGILKLDPATKELVILISGVGINTSIASHFFVYYYLSTAYHKEIRRILFRKMTTMINPTTSIA